MGSEPRQGSSSHFTEERLNSVHLNPPYLKIGLPTFDILLATLCEKVVGIGLWKLNSGVGEGKGWGCLDKTQVKNSHM